MSVLPSTPCKYAKRLSLRLTEFMLKIACMERIREPEKDKEPMSNLSRGSRAKGSSGGLQGFPAMAREIIGNRRDRFVDLNLSHETPSQFEHADLVETEIGI